jgi:DNA-binding NarL/FixJ family response regulator
MTMKEMKEITIVVSVAEKPIIQKRILIVDDHPVVRKGLAGVLIQNPEYFICGEAGDHPEAMAKLQELKPDLATLDLTLCHSHGLELIKDMHALFPKLLMLVVSMHDEILNARRVISAGARGYLSKLEPPLQLLTAVARIFAGEIYVSHHLTSQMALQLAGCKRDRPLPEIENLSDRELEIFELTGDGLNVRQIATRLRLGPATIATYCHRIKWKLGLSGHSQMLQSAIRWSRSGNLDDRLGAAGPAGAVRLRGSKPKR